jgi:hypothetical protein
MEDGNNEPEEEKFDIQAYHSTILKDFQDGLVKWLEKEEKEGEIEEVEDRELDALLLKVSTYHAGG